MLKLHNSESPFCIVIVNFIAFETRVSTKQKFRTNLAPKIIESNFTQKLYIHDLA